MTNSPILDYQLDILKLEIETINSTIRQMDEITKSIKEWTIGLWTAAVGGALATKDLNAYVAVTAVIPILFWFVDIWHRRIQRKFIWRSIEISNFLNDNRLMESFTAQKLIRFHVLGLGSTSYLSEAEENDRKAFTSWRYIMSFRSLSILYCGLTFVSLVLGVIQLFR